MSKNKIIKGFSELRSAWKQTETEADAKALIKGGGFHTRKLPKRPAPQPSKSPRSMSATDQFIVDTLAIQLDQLPLDQLYDARLTIQDAIECTFSSKESILHQLDTVEDHYDDQGRSWKLRAAAALRFKVQEGQELKKQLRLVDDLITKAKPTTVLKVVEATQAPAPVISNQIRRGVPLPNPRQSNNEWRKYAFEMLSHKDDSFPFPLGTNGNEARRMITAAQRVLNKRFSYRTERDGRIWVWLAGGPPRQKAQT
jgi:hypothetical protein